MKNKRWTKDEDDWLIKNSKKYTIDEICNILKINRTQLLYRSGVLKLNLKNKWSEEEFEILKNNSDKTCQEIREKYLPNRSIKSIQDKSRKLGIKKLYGRQWTEEEINKFIELYPNSSFAEISKILNMTENEYNWLREKYNLKQSKQRENERRRNNGKKTKAYWTEEKRIYLELLLSENNIHKTIQLFSLKYPIHTKYFIVDQILKCNIKIDENEILQYKKVKSIYNINNLNDTFKLYKKLLNTTVRKMPTFSKEYTIILFKYWLRINNISCTKDYVININNLRTLFDRSKLSFSISYNFRYYYEFIRCLMPTENIFPWELGIPVPNRFWDDNLNVFLMIRKGIQDLKNDNLINKDLDVLYLHRDILFNYFNKICLKKYKEKLMFVDYFKQKGIEINIEELRWFNNQKFDSMEELYIYKLIKSFGFKIKKCKKSDKLYNQKYDEYYIPDFIINYKNNNIILEYFGLYLIKPNISKFIKNYIEKTKRKVEYYTNNFPFFLSFYPNDILNNFEGVKNKLTSFFMFNFNINIKEVNK